MPEEYNIDNKYFPILLDLSKYRVLVIGGGTVALRKVNDLLNFNANITVISLKINKELEEIYELGLINVILKGFEKSDLNDFEIIFSSIDNPEISKSISEAAKEKKKLLNSADKPEFCDFILPANIIRGPLTISIASQGLAPFYVKHLKNKFDMAFPPLLANITILAGKFRNRILNEYNEIDEEKKQQLFTDFLEIKWDDILESTFNSAADEIIENIINKNIST